MAKFFRRIRENLLFRGRSAKYLKYAFGEIVLVVIGILIALQVNNWNEQKKADKKRQTIYAMINSDLEGDIAAVNEIIAYYERREPYTQHVLDGTLSKDDYSDSTYFSLVTYAPRISVTTRGFDLLKSASDDTAAEDPLQIAITEFYNLTTSRFEFLNDYIISDIEDNFSHWKQNHSWYPDYILRRNLDTFIAYTLTDTDYKNRVASYYFVHYGIAKGYLQEFVENAERLKELIQE